MANTKSVLIAEDDKVLSDMYKKLLENHGYSVITAENGEEGLFSAIERKPDLIILDIRMPKMNGLVMMENLRKDPWGKSVPIIVLTNLDANDETLVQVVRGMPSYYLLKSNTKPETVLEKISDVLNPN